MSINSIKKYIRENNIDVKGVLHVGSKSDSIHTVYNSINVHENNVIWIESDLDKAARNLANGLKNCFTTILDEKPPHNYTSSKEFCSNECCTDAPQLILEELEITKVQTLVEFMASNNFSPDEFNIWNFDTMGSELRIFKSSPQLLQFADVIYTGVNSTEITKKSTVKSELDILLRAHGLRRVETIKNADNWCMAIYIRL